jgi:hypothetical protein
MKALTGNNLKTSSPREKKTSSPIDLKTAFRTKINTALPNDLQPSSPTKSRFKNGSGGHSSRHPRGSRNKTTRFLEQLLEGSGENLARLILEFARNGDIHALRTVTARIDSKRVP